MCQTYNKPDALLHKTHSKMFLVLRLIMCRSVTSLSKITHQVWHNHKSHIQSKKQGNKNRLEKGWGENPLQTMLKCLMYLRCFMHNCIFNDSFVKRVFMLFLSLVLLCILAEKTTRAFRKLGQCPILSKNGQPYSIQKKALHNFNKKEAAADCRTHKRPGNMKLFCKLQFLCPCVGSFTYLPFYKNYMIITRAFFCYFILSRVFYSQLTLQQLIQNHLESQFIVGSRLSPSI